MRLQADFSCGVLVVGTGLAGIRSAIAAAKTGQPVILCSAGKLFSGSSFYPGTWGLGLIGPDGVEDEADLVDSILTLGAGMADEKMVRSFVSGINPAIEEIRAMGIRLKAAENKDQKDFIPCFDRKHRNWNGILFDSAREVFSRKLEELGVQILEHTEVLQLTKDGDRVDGAVIAMDGQIHWVHAGAVVLCSGGLGGLYSYRLTTDDVHSTGHALALEAGAALKNLEFMQIMPGFVSPCPKTIFNEKTFRYLRMEGVPVAQDLLELRSTHGPFTSRLADRAVDFAILRQQGAEGVLCRYDPSLGEDTPEFITTYFDWLRNTHGLTMADPFRIALYAHAANGGIVIDEHGFTEVPGLYAAGEITGGMHGADRIGGLSTANGLVFGARAGKAAAEDIHMTVRDAVDYDPEYLPDGEGKQNVLRSLMTRHALVDRNETGLQTAMNILNSFRSLRSVPDGVSRAELIHSQRVQHQITLARCVLKAQQLRRESRGSHFRSDHPARNDAMASSIRITAEHGSVHATFEK